MAGGWAAEDLFFSVRGLRLPIGLVLDEVEVTGSGVTVETEPFSVKLGAGACAKVRVSCDSIRDFLTSRDLGGLREIAVAAENGLLKVSGTAVVLIPIRASAYCSLEVRDGRMLDIVLQSADPAPARTLIERQLSGINPVLDLSVSFPDIAITSVEVADGWVVLHGRST